MKIAICDDDRFYLDEIKDFVEKWAAETNLLVEVFTFDNGDAMLDHHRKEGGDILFLDIMMPLFNGMDAAKEVRQYDPSVKIIFLTSTPEFAVESYEVKAFGYLLKPIHYDKICNVLNDCLQSIKKEEPNHMIVKTILGYQKIDTHNVVYIEAQNKKVVFNLSNGSCFEALDTLSHYEEMLTLEKGFFKCHRSYLVSIAHIDRFNETELITALSTRIPIARSHRKEFKDAYFTYMFEKEEIDHA